MDKLAIFVVLLSVLKTVKGNSSPTDELIDCSMNLINRYYENYTFFSYVPHAVSEDLLARASNQSIPLTVLNLDENLDVLQNFKYKHNLHIFVLTKLNEFENFVPFAYRTRGWNARAKILIIFLGDAAKLDGLFRSSWKYYSIDVSILTSKLKVFTYYPLTSTNCGDDLRAVYLGDCTNATLDVFPRKLGLYFHGCPMKVLPLVIQPYVLDLRRETNPGYEMMMLRAICKHLNITIQFIDHPFKTWGTILSNGSYTDMYKYMWEMKAEIMIGMVFANDSYVDDFEGTYPHSEVDLTFSVPTPLIVEGWKNFIIIFKKELWYSFGISMVSCIFTFWLIGNNQANGEGFDSFANCAFKVWCVIFSSFSRQPTNGLIRWIYLVWTIYSFLMISTYSSVLIGYLTLPSYEKEIATIKDMVDSNLKDGGIYNLPAIFNDPDNPTYMKIYRHFEICPLTMECTNRTAFKRDFGVNKNVRQIAYFTPLMFTYPNGRPRLRRVKDTVVPLCIWTNTVKGFIFAERFNAMVLRLREAGLVFKWDDEATNFWKRSIEIPPSVIPLNLTHLKFGFCCLFFGLSIAIVTFLCEIGIKFKNKTQLKSI